MEPYTRAEGTAGGVGRGINAALIKLGNSFFVYFHNESL
jgi:hypothetical protein